MGKAKMNSKKIRNMKKKKLVKMQKTKENLKNN